MSRVKVQGAGGKTVLLDQLREAIFDTVTLTNAGGSNGTREFFSDIQGKKKWQTNLNQANLLEKNVSFKILSMCLMAHAAVYANLNYLSAFIEKTSVRLQIGDRDFWKGSARFLAGGVYTEIAGGTDASYQQYGELSKHGVVFGKDAHEIPSLFTFKVVMDTDGVATAPNAAEDINLVCKLDGLKRRPVQ
jgi:hypothetical protein